MPFPDLTQGAAREAVSAADVQRLRSTGVLVEDPRRERPRWFDGRFLAARDLIREQQYVLTREADLGRAAGSGVAEGLRVTAGVEAQSLQIDAGHGVTPAGELVLLPRPLSVALANVAQAEQLSARFGLGRIPNAPLRSRTGLFVVALRPVEYTANPIGAYPSSLTGQRTVEDGDTIEATAVVLVPWPDDGAADALDARRGRAAREVFVAGGGASLSANVLPLALVALRNNTLDWVDEALVRRELGADRGDLPGLGFSPRALRLAHLMQYQDHLADVVARAAGSPFSAAAWFPALPSAGPLPAGLIDTRDFTQGFFPAEIDVDFSPVPDDELPALIEDALLLQPIDLQASADALDSTAVLIVAPVPRSDWRAVTARLAGTSRVVKPAAPNLLAQRKPFEVLQRLRLPRAALPVPDATNPSDTEWQRLARLPNLWFVRRRHLAITDDYTGAWQGVAGADERSTEAAVRSRVDALGLGASLQRVMDQATPAAAGTITNLLASKRLVDSAALTAATIGALSDAARAGAATAASGAAAAGGAEVAGPGATSPAGPAVAAAAAAPAVAAGPAPGAPAAAVPALPTRPSAQAAVPTLDLASVLKVAGDMSRPAVGAGLMRVEQAAGAAPLRPDTLRRIASNTEWKKLDTRAAQATPQAVQALSRGLNAPVGAPGRAPAAPALQPVAAQPASAAPTADAAQPKPAGPPADAEPLKPAEPAAAQPASAAPAADAAQPESAAPAAAQSVSAAPAAAQPVSAAPAADAAQPESAAPAAAQPAAPASAAALPAAQPVGPPAGRPGGAPIASSVFESPAASATLHVPPPANVAPRPAFAASTVVAAPRSFAPTAVAAAAATAAAATAPPATEALAAPFASLAEGAAPAAATASIDPGDSPTRSGQIARREAGNAPST